MSIRVSNTAHTYPAAFWWLCVVGLFLATGEWISGVQQARGHPVLLTLLAVAVLVCAALLARAGDRPLRMYPLALGGTLLTTAVLILLFDAFARVGVFHATIFGRTFGLGTAVLTLVPLFFVAYTVVLVPVGIVGTLAMQRQRARALAPLDAAVALAREAADAQPDSADAQMALARALTDKWRHASRTMPNAPDGFRDAEYLRGQRELVDAAVAALRVAARLAPQRADVVRALGYELLRQEQYDEALATLRQSLALEPEVYARLTVGNLLLNATQDVPAAVAEFREAVRLYPDVAQAHHVLGKALKRAGDRDAALAAMLRAHELEPANREYAYDHDFLRREMSADRTGAGTSSPASGP